LPSSTTAWATCARCRRRWSMSPAAKPVSSPPIRPWSAPPSASSFPARARCRTACANSMRAACASRAAGAKDKPFSASASASRCCSSTATKAMCRHSASSRQCRRFPDEKWWLPGGERLKVPHMGWNEVRSSRMPVGRHRRWRPLLFRAQLFRQPADPALVTGTCEYGVPFTCAVGRDNIFAVQFHPEKSARDGLQLLKNFVEWHP
jgi:glutamine amidotransferase